MTDDMVPQGRMVPNPPHGHEVGDVSIRALITAAVGLIALCLVVMFILAEMMQGYARRDKQLESLRPALFSDTEGLYPGPNLQDNPTAEMIKMRTDERRSLGTYGWVDRNDGVARIPIERAMDLLVAKGLPARDRNASPQTKAETKPEAR
jgi:hypothetical protein